MLEFGVFILAQQRGYHQTSAQVIKNSIEQTVTADAAGFDAAWYAEHHFNNYSLSPSPLMMVAHCAALTKRIRLGTATNSGEVLRMLALAGHGIALLYDYTVQADLDSGRLHRLLPHLAVTNATFQYSRGIYAVFRQTDYIPAKIRAFIDFFSAHRVRTQLCTVETP